MAILPAGFAVPPLPYLLVLGVSVLAVVGALYRVSPPVTERTVLALAPWMVCGSALYVCYGIGAIPAVVAPFFGSPAVYLTTFVFLGACWIASMRLIDRTPERVDIAVGTVGLVLALCVIGFALSVGIERESIGATWPAIGLVVASVLAGAVWTVVRRTHAGITGWAGALVVFAHTLDGVSTAVGIDVLGFGEQTPLARVFLDLGASLPVADLVGAGWPFVAVKVVLAAVVTWLLADSVREHPREGYLLCALVAAVGLGPGAHNLLLFTVTG